MQVGGEDQALSPRLHSVSLSSYSRTAVNVPGSKVPLVSQIEQSHTGH